MPRKMGDGMQLNRKELEIWAPSNVFLKKFRDGVRDQGRKTILSMLERQPEAYFLDLGCSIGDFTLEMSRRIGTSKVVGVDKTLYFGSLISVQVIDLDNDLPFSSDTFDVVVASQLLEHLKSPRYLIEEVYRVLRPGGYLIVSTPNLSSWHNILFLLFGVQPPGLSITRDHRFLLTVQGIVNLIKLGKFKVERVVGVGFYPFPYPISALLCKIDRRHPVDVIVKARKCSHI